LAKATSNTKLKLHGFNNLTKTLSFNIYDICFARTKQHQQEYVEYIDEAYNAERLTAILTEVANIIGANILNVARQDYDPQGASVTMLISEGHHDGLHVPKGSVVTHLDKSHITVTPIRRPTPTPASPRSAPTSTCRPAARSRR